MGRLARLCTKPQFVANALTPVPVGGARRRVGSAPMTPAAIVDAVKRHNLFSWSAAGKVDPPVLSSARGVWLHSGSGEKWMDFNSGLMCANIGHGHPRVVAAIKEQVRQGDAQTCA